MSAGNHLHSGTNVVALIVCGTYVLVTGQVYIRYSGGLWNSCRVEESFST